MAAVVGGKKLLIRSLPPELNDEDKEDLLRKFGANSVVCFGKRGKMRNSAFASFGSHGDAESAMKRLHQLEILGCFLRVEYANETCEKLANGQESRKILNKASNVGSSKKKKENHDENKEEENDEIQSGIAPKLGLHQDFPRHLSYLYPPPTVTILTNIANALASVPKFYVQVLHLMNKMSLPPPFTGPTITPPLPDDTITLIDAAVDTNDLYLNASSEESELESDEESSQTGKLFGDAKTNQIEPVRRKRRLRATNITVEKSKKLKQQDLDDAFEQTQQVTMKRIEFKLAASIAANIASASNPPGRGDYEQGRDVAERNMDYEMTRVDSREAQGFGVFEPGKERENVLQEEEEIPGAGEEFISLQEIEQNRMSESDLASLSQMKKYEKGQQSNRLYIKNLAKQTEKEDLEYIFHRFLNKCDEEEKEMFDIRLMKEGRMKGQAFVTFPTDELAAKAMALLHGYVLHEKPVIIQFGRTTKS